MTRDDAILKYNLINSLIFSDGEYSVSRELKVKLIRYKFNFEKIFNEFTEAQTKYIDELKSNEEYTSLVAKEKRTDKENSKLDELIKSMNEELNSLLSQKLLEEVETNWYTPLTEDEFNQLLEVNIEHPVSINGINYDGTGFVNLLHKFLL